MIGIEELDQAVWGGEKHACSLSDIPQLALLARNIIAISASIGVSLLIDGADHSLSLPGLSIAWAACGKTSRA